MSEARNAANPRATLLVAAVAAAAGIAGAAAGIARLCHAAPLVTARIGRDFDRLAHTLEPFRSLLLFATLALLLLGAGLAYLPGVARPAAAQAMEVGALAKLALAIAIAIGVVALAAPSAAVWALR